MKHKIIAIISICMAFVIITVSLYFSSYEDKQRYHQHIQAPKKSPCQHTDNTLCTQLPLIQIDTGGVDIPGRSLHGDLKNLTVTEKGESQVSCSLQLTDNTTKNNHPTDSPTIQSKAVINVRGRSSRSFDKVGYSIRLVTDSNQNNPLSLAGMAAHHEWVLHGPYLDKTLLRNYMWYNLSGEIMDYAPNVRFCEVVINGEYMGVYVLAESITAGKNGARLQLSVDKKDNSFTGYLLRMDSGSPTEIKNIDPFSVYTLRFPNKVDIVYPGATNLTPNIAENIRQDFSRFEKTIYSFDYDSKDYGYKTMIDVDSFVDYFILNEFTLNYDAGWLSTYIYKDLDNKYRMCVWDFNSACDNYQEAAISPKGFNFQYCVWYVMLTKDEDFVERIISRYYELRKSVLSEEYLFSYIDNTVNYLGDAVTRNFDKWGYTFDDDHVLLVPIERNIHSYQEAIGSLKANISARGKWLDENIHTLRQYSAESKVKKYNEHTD